MNRALIHTLLQNTQTVQNGIQIGLHGRTAQLDQCDLHQNTFLGGIADLAGQIRKNTDVAHQRLYIHHLTFFLQKLQVLGRDVNGLFRVLGRFHKEKITHVPGKISYKLSKLPSAYDQILQSADGRGHIPLKDLAQKFAEHFCVNCAKHFQNLVIGQGLSQIKGNALVKKT